MIPVPSLSSDWRQLTVGLVLPDVAFGAAVDVDDLLDEPELHFSATPSSSRLLLLPRAGSFTRLVLEWENLPEIGVFTAGAAPGDALPPEQTARLETWMRDVAVICHAMRDAIREASERAVDDAAAGASESLPRREAASTRVVSAHIGTSVAGPDPALPFGVVDVVVGDHPGLMLFVDRATGETLGRRITTRDGDEVVAVRFEPLAASVQPALLQAWYDQHIAREVLFDDVWQVYVHLITGLDAPASVHSPG